MVILRKSKSEISGAMQADSGCSCRGTVGESVQHSCHGMGFESSMVTVLTHSPEETEAFGVRLAAQLAQGDIIALNGPLGAGKTCLVRGLARGLGHDPLRVRSPTFVLHHVYREGRIPLHHLDLYRLGEGAVTDEFDLDLLAGDGVVAMEWASLARDAELPGTIVVELIPLEGDSREIRLGDDVPERLRKAAGEENA